MTGLMLASLLAACPEGALFERPEQQEAACVLAARTAVQTDRVTLVRLLEEPEFARARNRNSTAFTLLWEQFFAWLKRLFQTQEAARFAKAVPFAVLTLAFAVALLAVLRFGRFRRKRREQPAGHLGTALPLKPAPEHLANARRLLATAPRDSIREALLALLSSLERRNLARPDRVKTNREICTELPARGADPSLAGQVRARLDWYDRVFYSLADVSAEDARSFVEDVERLVLA